MKDKIIFGIALILIVFIVVAPFLPRTEQAQANIALGGEYGPVGTGYSTTTSPLFNLPARVSLIKNGRGSFGSFIIREAGVAGGDYEFYDATTTNVNLRTGNLASSTIFLGSIPADAAVGDYRFDVALNAGLIMVWTGSGTVATTTITVR